MSSEKESDKDLSHFWALSQAGINADKGVMDAFLKMNFFSDKNKPDSSSPELQSDPENSSSMKKDKP
jgi:hypothetical protein